MYIIVSATWTLTAMVLTETRHRLITVFGQFFKTINSRQTNYPPFSVVTLHEQCVYIYTGKYSPPFCFRPFRSYCQQVNLKLNEFRTNFRLLRELESASCTRLCQGGFKTRRNVWNCREANNIGAKITLYTV